MRPVAPPQRLIWWIIAAVVFALLPLTGKLVNLLTDFLLFEELGLQGLFMRMLGTTVGLGVIVGLIAWVLIYANIFIARRLSATSPRFGGAVSMRLLQFFNIVPMLQVALLVASLLIAFFIGSWAASFWEEFLKYRHAVPFNLTDPLFGKDVGFYILQLPFYRFVYLAAIAILLFSFIGSLLVYVVGQNAAYDGRRVLLTPRARTHLLILTGLAVASLFFVFQYLMYQAVNASSTIVNGAGYAMVKAGLPILSVMRFVSLLAAVLVWATIFRRTLRLVAAAVLLIVAGVVLEVIAVQTVQKFVVGPDELAKETPYIDWSIASTRAAFGLDTIATRDFTPTNELTSAALQRNTPTIANIRLWEQAPLLTTYSQLQEIRTYYEFLDVDNDRYTINGQYRQVMLSPRELVPASLPSRIWINEHLTYTHGYGLCLGPVTSVTAEGLPEFYIKNIPPVSTIPMQISRPQIYYGEADAGYAIVKTGSKEFDYPSGNENVYTSYTGQGGIRISGLWRKTLFALRFRELKILLRNDLTADSRILINRQILERFRTAVPFLRYDPDPYMVITAEGRLVWMIDGYTTAAAYPYSATVSGLGNYIRNSVKAVIDAYDGTLQLYIADAADPIIQTYSRIFPGVFKPLADMPTDLRSHVRYPQTLFTVQARVYALYHMTDPQVFYNKEDVWRIPDSYTEGQSGPMSPYYTIMKLAEVGQKEEFILMVPFCPAKKENMIAWMAARCDQPNYGTLLVFEFPKQKLVYGPSQIESRISQDPEISKQLALWNQGGSRVIRGSLLVIPVEQSLLYVQPLYLTSKDGGVPELKRVIVAFENRIAMEATLENSLQLIFGGRISTPEAAQPAGGPVTAVAEDLKGLIAEANRQFERGQEALRQGDWAAYGEAMQRVERLLQELGQQSR